MPSVGVETKPSACPKAFLVLVGAAMASRIARAESRATERVIWSAEARAELFCRFFIFFVGLNLQFDPLFYG